MSDTWTIEANDAGVRAWSSFRQPFEPRDERLRYRTMLQAALRNVQRGSSSPLRAAYVSENTSFCDAENILFYNVGSGAFFGAVAARASVRTRLHRAASRCDRAVVATLL